MLEPGNILVLFYSASLSPCQCYISVLCCVKFYFILFCSFQYTDDPRIWILVSCSMIAWLFFFPKWDQYLLHRQKFSFLFPALSSIFVCVACSILSVFCIIGLVCCSKVMGACSKGMGCCSKGMSSCSTRKGCWRTGMGYWNTWIINSSKERG